MSAPYFYFQNDSTGAIFAIDSNTNSLKLPQVSRNYTVQNLFSDGAIISGNGSMQPGIISFTKIFTNAGGNVNTMTAARANCLSFFGLAKNQVLYFYIVTATGLTLRQRVYPITKSDENYSTLGISDSVSFDFQMEKSYFYNVVANTVNYNPVSNQLETFTINNNGQLNVAPIFSFTPTGNFSTITISAAAGNYGFTLSSSFIAAQPITFDCGTGIITVNGVITTGIQSAGSIFNLKPGSNLMYIQATPGVLQTSIFERYL